MDDVLSKERLQLLIGDADLEQARYLELKVDSRKIGLGHLSKFIPKVKQLKLNNSFVPMVRDIGHGYNNLTVLWMARCNLSDLDGIQSIRGLKELYLAFNNISEISAVGMLDQLEILDLERSRI
jgi:Leucine-rich repeat (LRR) protein